MLNPGFRNIQGFFYDDPAIEKMSHAEEIRLYQEINNNDPIAVASMETLTAPLNGQLWDFSIDNQTESGKKCRDFLYRVFEKIDFGSFRYHYFLHLRFGSAWFEKIWESGAEGFEMAELFPLKPDTIWKTYPTRNGIEKIIQRAYEPVTGRFEEKALDGKNIFWTANNMEFGDPRGRSIWKPIRPYYLLKKNLLRSDARLRERAAGIVMGFLSAEMMQQYGADMASALQKIGNNIDNYALFVKDQMDVRLESPQQQQGNIDFLRYYDQCIFYNTQTQFMVAGIGSGVNGGRANTESHKGTYINKVNYLITRFDSDIRKLVNEMIDNSVYSGLKPEERPYFQTARISHMDIFAVAETVSKMGSALKIRPEDEIWFRAAFGMPEIDLSQIQAEQEKENEFQRVLDSAISSADPQKPELEMSLFPDGFIDEKKKSKMTNRCRDVMELQAMITGFQTISREAEKTIRAQYNQAIKDLAKRVAKNPESIRAGKKTSMINALLPLYRRAKKQGAAVMVKEIQKATGKTIELSKYLELETIQEAPDRDRLGLLISRAFESVETAIENDMLNVTADFLERRGGLENWLINRYADGNKRLLADIQSFIEGGLIDGRGEIIDSLGDEVSVWEYTSVLDDTVCSVCRPYDGQRKTLEQWKNAGIQQFSPVNPGCEGGAKCRCVLVPIA